MVSAISAHLLRCAQHRPSSWWKVKKDGRGPGVTLLSDAPGRQAVLHEVGVGVGEVQRIRPVARVVPLATSAKVNSFPSGRSIRARWSAPVTGFSLLQARFLRVGLVRG